jgi:hypothetical protein
MISFGMTSLTMSLHTTRRTMATLSYFSASFFPGRPRHLVKSFVLETVRHVGMESREPRDRIPCSFEIVHATLVKLLRVAQFQNQGLKGEFDLLSRTLVKIGHLEVKFTKPLPRPTPRWPSPAPR